jgi:hypothetical protein
MLGTLPLDAMSEDDLLDLADERAEDARRAVDERSSALPGREGWRTLRIGRDGVHAHVKVVPYSCTTNEGVRDVCHRERGA